MRHNPAFASTDAELAASPVMLDEEAPDLTLLTHLGRPDEEILGVGAGGDEEGEVLVRRRI